MFGMKDYLFLKKNISKIEKSIGYTFKNKNLLTQSFVHSSFFNEHPHLVKMHNERLEFLGDSVLGLIMSEYLFKKFSKFREGELSMIKSKIVDALACADFAENLDLQKFILLGKGEKRGGEKQNIFADFFEALLGAIFLDSDFVKAKEFFLKNFEKSIKSIIQNLPQNYKERLQHYCQKKYGNLPEYRVIKEEGPDHKKNFEVAVFINKKRVGVGTGKNKKIAQQEAAKNGLKKLCQ